MLKGILGALAGGAVGGLIWALIAYYTNYEIGFVAWAVGALAGVGMMVGSRDVQSSLGGVLAAVIALASIAGAKYAVVNILVNEQTSKFQRDFVVTEEHTKVYVAHQLVDEYQKGGKPLKWPEGYSAETADEAAHFPPDLWKDLEERWKALSSEQKDVYQQATERDFKDFMSNVSSEAASEGFLGSFSYWDVIWGVLAILSAYKIGSGEGGD